MEILLSVIINLKKVKLCTPNMTNNLRNSKMTMLRHIRTQKEDRKILYKKKRIIYRISLEVTNLSIFYHKNSLNF